MAPAWSADGHTILFTSDRSGERDLYQKNAQGARPGSLVFSSADSKSLNAWSRGGRFAIYDTGARASTQGHINKDLMLGILDRTPRSRPLAATKAAESTADISPDGTLVAYQSTETGRHECSYRPFRTRSNASR